MNVCSYHLQEAGATPVQELAFALATAIAVLDAVKASRRSRGSGFRPKVVGRISFFVNAGIRFVTEMCKMRAFVSSGRRSPRALRRPDDEKRSAASATACRSTRSASPSSSRRTTSIASCSRCWRHAVEERARPRRAAAGLERGARPAAPVGPAMVAAHAADPGLRDRSARVRRHLRRLPEIAARSSAEATRRAPSWPHRRHGRRRRCHRDRLHEAAPGREPTRRRLEGSKPASRRSSASTPHRRPNPRRSPGRRRRRSWSTESACRGRADRPLKAWRAAATQARSPRRSPS
jgi:hypothetical protein